MGEPHNVAAIILLCRYRANPKSATKRNRGRSGAVLESLHLLQLILPTLPSLPINLCSLYPTSARL